MRIKIIYTIFLALILTVIVLTSVFAFATAFRYWNQDYITPLTQTNTNESPPASSPSQESGQSYTSINSNGTKHFEINMRLSVTTTFNLGGSYFSIQKYNFFNWATILQETSMEIIKQMAEHVRDIAESMAIFLAILAMPLILGRHYGVR